MLLEICFILSENEDKMKQIRYIFIKISIIGKQNKKTSANYDAVEVELQKSVYFQ